MSSAARKGDSVCVHGFLVELRRSTDLERPRPRVPGLLLPPESPRLLPQRQNPSSSSSQLGMLFVLTEGGVAGEQKDCQPAGGAPGPYSKSCAARCLQGELALVLSVEIL